MIFSEKYRDVLLEIFGYIRIADLIKFKRVSKYLRTLVNNYIPKITHLLWVNPNCLYKIFRFLDIISLIKLRGVSKHLQILANNYMPENEKLCDMLAYDCEYLLTPEYLVINNNIFNETPRNNILFIIDHIHKFSNTLRLILFNKYSNHRYGLTTIDKDMPKLKYFICAHSDITSGGAPNLRYNSSYDANISDSNKTCCITKEVKKIHTNIKNVVINISFGMAKYIRNFPNCEKLYIMSRSLSVNQLHITDVFSFIKEIYIHCNIELYEVDKIFPKLEIIYFDMIKKAYVNGITIKKLNTFGVPYLVGNADSVKIYNNNIAASNKVKTVTILKNLVLPDLSKLFPNLLDIYIAVDTYKFKLGNIYITNMDYYDEIKKLVFSS